MSDVTEKVEAQGDEAQPSATPQQQTNGEDYEARARTMGWRPRHEWRGPDSRWVDAQTFVEKGEQHLPMARERNAHLERKIQEQNAQISELKDIMGQQLDRQRRAEMIGYKRAMRELEAQKAEAVRNADPIAVARVDAEIRDMGPDPVMEESRRQQQAPAPPQQPQQQRPDPIVVDWVQDNPWVTQNPTAWDMAVTTLNRVQAEQPRSSLEDQLAEVKKRVMPLFVQESPPPRREAPAAVSRSQNMGGPARVQPRTFAAMPLEVQKQFEKEKRAVAGKGKELTRDEFAMYYWEQFPEDGT